MRYFPTLTSAMCIFVIHAGIAHAQTRQIPTVPDTQTSSQQIARGQYLVRLSGCGDCHTPGYLLGKPDMTRYLGGSDVGLAVPHLGVFVAPNLTPDKDTGLGAWTRLQIVTAIRTGVRPDGRVLASVMPWRGFAVLTDEDAYAVADFLKSLPPVAHKVPGPFSPGEKLPVPQMAVVPPTAEVAQP